MTPGILLGFDYLWPLSLVFLGLNHGILVFIFYARHRGVTFPLKITTTYLMVVILKHESEIYIDKIDAPPKFNISPLKNDGWKITFLLG